MDENMYLRSRKLVIFIIIIILCAIIIYNYKRITRPVYLKLDSISRIDDLALLKPGLGLSELHSLGYTGKGVNVAIIDGPLTEHSEFSDRIVHREQVGFILRRQYGHGTVVASILAGRRTGVAPEANLHYFEVSHLDINYIVKAVIRIITYNRKLGEKDKIRFVNVSSGFRDEKISTKLKEIIKMAADNGIIVFTSSMPTYTSIPLALREASVKAGGSIDEIDDIVLHKGVIKYLKDTNETQLIELRKLSDKQQNYATMYIPIDSRYFASYYDNDGYLCDTNGGLSWATPVLTGLAALALQVNPNLTNEEILEVLSASVITNKNNIDVIWPDKVVENAMNK